MRSAFRPLAVALAFAACRADSIGTRIEASLLEVDDPPQFSDWSAPVNLAEPVNSPAVEGTPVVSKDGLSLYFAAGQGRLPNCGAQDIWVSTRASVDEPWGIPQTLGCTVNSAAHDNEPALSPDGHLLFFTRTTGNAIGVGQDLYVSRRRDKRDDFAWQTPTPVGGAVNSAANESGAALIEDDVTETITLYFASNRAGGIGGSDIYASTRLPDGTFGEPELVEELSSPLEDVMPEIGRDGRELLLVSDRVGTLGNLDIWVATRASTRDPWSTPVNLGPGINSAFFDGGPALSFRGTELYFQSAFRPENIGGPMFDIWVATRNKLKGRDARIEASLIEADDPLQFSDWSVPANLGAPVNTTAGEAGAFVAKDGLSFYFTSTRPGSCGGFDIWVSTRASADDPWGDPANLGCDINSAGLDAAPVLTIDGHRLYFHSDRPGGAGGVDLYVSRRRDKRDPLGWQTPENLGSDVNTALAEVQPAVFEDDESGITTLFFAGRVGAPGGLGAADIYRSTLQADGAFGPAVLVSELSSPFQDQGPAIRRDGLEFFLSSARPGTLGAVDLWTSTRASTSDPWSTPVHMGAVINSAVLDDRPTLSFDGTALYFQSPRDGGLGANDIYVITRTKLKGED
ncbi:MAG TPA: hypothetical protein VK573_05985 [Gemmatimonadales bacterium]|nr:hypothetical protein [Gemmatimonadales bacterium]